MQAVCQSTTNKCVSLKSFYIFFLLKKNILSFHFISNILFISPSCLQSSLFYSLFFCSFKNLPFICFSLNIFTTFSLFKFRINSVLYFPPTLLCDSLIMLFLFPLSFPPSLVLYGSSSQTWIFLNNNLI